MSTRILTVDDSCSMRSMVRGALESAGYEVHEAGGGEEALGFLGRSAVDLVITDFYMPGMDGLALLAQIRGMRQYRFTPVLLLSTEHAEEMKQRGRAAGATGWLVKPFQPEQLRDVVARVLGAARVRA
jgi:two-component system chemotaxis response regulator CheY